MAKNKISFRMKILPKIVLVLVAFGTIILFVSGAFMAGIAYNKIVKENGSAINSTPTPDEGKVTPFNFCRRKISHATEPRFMRALSLLAERTSVTNTQNATLALRFYLQPILPCLDVQYCSGSQMQDAEGIFTFSESTANRDRLLICVSESYKQEDDLLTASLLAHEATHAVQFVLDATNTAYGAYSRSCYGKEAMAFTEQTLFMRSLTNGELQSLFSRMFDNSQLNPRIATLKTLVEILMQSGMACIQQPDTNDERAFCTIREDLSRLEKMVRGNAYYQAECGR